MYTGRLHNAGDIMIMNDICKAKIITNNVPKTKTKMTTNNTQKIKIKNLTDVKKKELF